MWLVLDCTAEDILKLNPVMPFLGGALAGCAATIGSYPFDLLRTVLASQGEPKVCSSSMSCFRWCNSTLKYTLSWEVGVLRPVSLLGAGVP